MTVGIGIAAIRNDFFYRSCRGAVTFLAKKVTKNAFACPEVALRTRLFHKFSKHGLGTPETVCV
jgi:hypothetical protein